MDPDDELEEADSSDDDELDCELDVYMSHKLLAARSEKLYVMQSPLRAPWRPYDLEAASKVQLKPATGRLQMEIPLQTRGSNVDPDAQPGMKLKQLSLLSQPADLATSFAIDMACFAIMKPKPPELLPPRSKCGRAALARFFLQRGTIRDGRMVLTPFTEALQLRPSMAHVDAAAGKGGKGGAVEAESPEEEEDVKPQLQPVKVNVQRRETERQTEMRLKSYSYHAQQEEHEPWVDLEVVDVLARSRCCAAGSGKRRGCGRVGRHHLAAADQRAADHEPRSLPGCGHSRCGRQRAGGRMQPAAGQRWCEAAAWAATAASGRPRPRCLSDRGAAAASASCGAGGTPCGSGPIVQPADCRQPTVRQARPIVRTGSRPSPACDNSVRPGSDDGADGHGRGRFRQGTLFQNGFNHKGPGHATGRRRPISDKGLCAEGRRASGVGGVQEGQIPGRII